MAKLVQAHGHFRTCTCLNASCRRKYDQRWYMQRIRGAGVDEPVAPRCDDCHSWVKPDVVLFGDALPSGFGRDIPADFGACDLVIIAGTSLAVKPFSLLINYTPSGVKRVLVNNECIVFC